MPKWFENDEIWEDTFEFMFPRKRMEAGDSEIEDLLRLTHLPAESVLDLACGPGRHAIPLSKRGYKVTGVDLSPFLLEKARGFAKENRQTVEFLNEDMRTFSRPNSFRSCVCLFSSFVLESRADDLAVLRKVQENLQGDGAFVLDVMGKEILAKVYAPESELTTHDGTRFKKTHKILNDWTRIENVWRIEKNGAVKTYQFRHNIYSGFELKQLLGEAGFRGIRLYGGFDGRLYDEKANRLIAIAMKQANSERLPPKSSKIRKSPQFRFDKLQGLAEDSGAQSAQGRTTGITEVGEPEHAQSDYEFDSRAFPSILERAAPALSGSGAFRLWLRFGSVAGRCGHAPSPKHCQKPKIPRSASLHHFCQCSNVPAQTGGSGPRHVPATGGPCFEQGWAEPGKENCRKAAKRHFSLIPGRFGGAPCRSD